MNYNEAIEYIHSLSRFGSKPGLERIKGLTARLGNPQEKLKFVHIAGTNGKGSTAAFLASVLNSCGYRTGLYTSPYVVHFNERIRIGDQEIADEELASYTARIKDVINAMIADGLEHPTEFEVITALAFLYYYEKQCDVVVLEVGMGGRFDATNIINTPVVSVITKIAMDHMHILGDTLAKIAYEKAGIIKNQGLVISYPQEESAGQVIKAVCQEKHARLFTACVEDLKEIYMEKGALHFTHPAYGKLQTSIIGTHQVFNAAVALKTLDVLITTGFLIPIESIREGFLNARWLGRFELLRSEPDFYIDAAHNLDGVKAFVSTFQTIYPGKKAIILFGVMKDKEYEAMIRELSIITEKFIAVQPETSRALPVEMLVKVMREYCNHVEYSVTIKETMEKILNTVSKEDIIAALGSLFYIGQVRSIFL